jgi:hypothetical protein
MNPSVVLDLKFLNEPAANNVRNFKSTTLVEDHLLRRIGSDRSQPS